MLSCFLMLNKIKNVVNVRNSRPPHHGLDPILSSGPLCWPSSLLLSGVDGYPALFLVGLNANVA